MNDKKTHITYLDDVEGTNKGVQLSPELWLRVKNRILAIELSLYSEKNPFSRPEPFEQLDELKSYWDFKYPYSPDVRCNNCGTATMDWEKDPNHPFHLTNANFAGLLVFKCKACSSTVRKKHFKDHVAFEVSPSKDSE